MHLNVRSHNTGFQFGAFMEELYYSLRLKINADLYDEVKLHSKAKQWKKYRGLNNTDIICSMLLITTEN